MWGTPHRSMRISTGPASPFTRTVSGSAAASGATARTHSATSPAIAKRRRSIRDSPARAPGAAASRPDPSQSLQQALALTVPPFPYRDLEYPRPPLTSAPVEASDSHRRTDEGGPEAAPRDHAVIPGGRPRPVWAPRFAASLQVVLPIPPQLSRSHSCRGESG